MFEDTSLRIKYYKFLRRCKRIIRSQPTQVTYALICILVLTALYILLSPSSIDTTQERNLTKEVTGFYIKEKKNPSEVIPVWWCYGHRSFGDRFNEHNIEVL
jgi:hypothetical protein